jgi:hypothetical protein
MLFLTETPLGKNGNITLPCITVLIQKDKVWKKYKLQKRIYIFGGPVCSMFTRPHPPLIPITQGYTNVHP